MGTWKYFTDEETKGMDPGVVFGLENARGICGFPIKMTSGYRSLEHNAEIGGVPFSAHTKGLAADLEAPVGQFEREKLIWALGLSGFKRIELCPRHIHVDLDAQKECPCCWQGEDK